MPNLRQDAGAGGAGLGARPRTGPAADAAVVPLPGLPGPARTRAASSGRWPRRRGTWTWRRLPRGIPSCARRSPAASRWPTSRAASWSSCWSSTRSRQLAALHAILTRIEGELRASQVTSALRLAFLHAILPSSRLNGYPGRASSLRITEGRVRPAGAPGWRERNPWRAFEEGYQLVRAFVQALDEGPHGAVEARLADPLDGVFDGPPMISLRVGSGDAYGRLAAEAEALTGAQRARVRLVLAQPLPEWTPGRLSQAFVVTAWGLGSEAAKLLPFAPLLDAGARPPRRAPALRAALEAAAPAMAPDAVGVILLDPDGAPGMAANAVAGVAAGWRLAAARLAEPGRTPGGIIELVPPRAASATLRGPAPTGPSRRRRAVPATRPSSPPGACSGAPRRLRGASP